MSGLTILLNSPITRFRFQDCFSSWRLPFHPFLRNAPFCLSFSLSVVAAATSLALERGFSDSIFGVTLVYAGLVMYDAQGVRREVGNHAKVLNAILAKRRVSSVSVVSEDRDDLIDSRDETSESAGNFEGLSPILSKKPRSLASKTVNASVLIASDKETRQSFEFAGDDCEVLDQIRLKESIGHTEVEVVAGALLGFLVSLAVYSIIV
ncbi:hypothetical protein V6N12_019893 [Hibiscus sabdariffa]|uniref:Uncharacterized protein n=1 Tax=Hibiscus sabdariffa TaxID=183260 RepID=A0ABR1ZWB7_9ROSI